MSFGIKLGKFILIMAFMAFSGAIGAGFLIEHSTSGFILFYAIMYLALMIWAAYVSLKEVFYAELLSDESQLDRMTLITDIKDWREIADYMVKFIEKHHVDDPDTAEEIHEFSKMINRYHWMRKNGNRG